MAKFSPDSFVTIGIIVGCEFVGDSLLKLPFLRALKKAFPKAEIHWITSQGPTAFASQLRSLTHDLVDQVHEKPTWLSDGRCDGFDLLIDTRSHWQTALQARRIPHKLFLASAKHYLFSGKRPSLFRRRPPHLVDRLLQMVELAAGFVPPSTGSLPVSEILLAKARQLLPKNGLYVGLAPGAGNSIKIWPRTRFIELAKLQADAGHTPIFLLGPQEQGWLEELKDAVPTALFPLQASKVWGSPSITIEQTLAIGSLLDIAVANDSGTGHMLATVDCPLISLFGPTSPAKLAPRVSRGTVIRAQAFGGEAMDAIPVEAVNDVVNRILDS